jgi:hypothetical protein
MTGKIKQKRWRFDGFSLQEPLKSELAAGVSVA